MKGPPVKGPPGGLAGEGPQECRLGLADEGPAGEGAAGRPQECRLGLADEGPQECRLGLAGITKKPAPAGFLLDIQFSNPKFAQICYFFDPCVVTIIILHVVDCQKSRLIRTKRENIGCYSDYWDIFSIKIDVM